jgi:hypothetical protein
MKSFLILLILFLFASAPVYADMSAILKQPDRETWNNRFEVTFSLNDRPAQPVSVKCFKQGPGEALFSNFGSELLLDATQNEGICKVDEEVIKKDGIYRLEVVARSGNTSVYSNVIQLNYADKKPLAPEATAMKLSDCEYELEIKSNTLKKIDVFISSDSDVINHNSLIQSFNWPSGNESIKIRDTVEKCNLKYTYLVRGSDESGKSTVLTVAQVKVPEPSPSPSPVVKKANTSPLPSASPQQVPGEVLGIEKNEEKPKVYDQWFSLRTAGLATGVGLVIFGLVGWMWSLFHRPKVDEISSESEQE